MIYDRWMDDGSLYYGKAIITIRYFITRNHYNLVVTKFNRNKLYDFSSSFLFFLSFLQVFLSSIHHLWISYIFTRIIICGYTCGFSKIDFNRNFKNVFTWGYVKFQTLSTQSNSLPRFITIGLSMFLSGMQMKPFIPLTAQELVFGYDDPLVSIAHRFFPISRRPMSKMGILNGVSYYNTFIFILYL